MNLKDPEIFSGCKSCTKIKNMKSNKQTLEKMSSNIARNSNKKTVNKNYFNSQLSNFSYNKKTPYPTQKKNNSYLDNFKNQAYVPPTAKPLSQPENNPNYNVNSQNYNNQNNNQAQNTYTANNNNAQNQNNNFNNNSTNNQDNPMSKIAPFLKILKGGGKFDTKDIGSLVSSLNGGNTNPNLNKILGAVSNTKEETNFSGMNNILSLMSGNGSNPNSMLLSLLPALLTNKTGTMSSKSFTKKSSTKKIGTFEKA